MMLIRFLEAERASPPSIREEFSVENDLDSITLWILYFIDMTLKVNCRHDAVAELTEMHG